jgi:hypothetical protein
MDMNPTVAPRWYRYQEELSHFPQKAAFYASECVNWRFRVPGKIVTESTTAGIGSVLTFVPLETILVLGL